MARETIGPIDLRPTVVDVDLSALAHNFTVLREHVKPSKILAVIKANAYGHGLVPCAERLGALGVDYLGVAFVEEGLMLRAAGVRSPILVLGGVVGAQIGLFLEHDLEITASSVAKLEAIEEAAAKTGKRARVHLKVDTGMERIGVHYYSAESFLERALLCSHCDIVGIYSHFARAEDDSAFTREQLVRFEECVDFFRQHSLPPPLRHIANSAALLSLPETHLDMVRPGLALYGVWPSSSFPRPLDLRPVLSLRSQVVYFKVVKSGAGVSYGHTWQAPSDTRMVTVPVGYGDGYSRRLSNRAAVLIRGKRCPVRGNICMDQLLVDLGPRGEAYNGDEVVLIGRQDGEEIRVNDIADLMETTPHEVLTSLNLRLPRRHGG